MIPAHTTTPWFLVPLSPGIPALQQGRDVRIDRSSRQIRIDAQTPRHGRWMVVLDGVDFENLVHHTSHVVLDESGCGAGIGWTDTVHGADADDTAIFEALTRAAFSFSGIDADHNGTLRGISPDGVTVTASTSRFSSDVWMTIPVTNVDYRPI